MVIRQLTKHDLANDQFRTQFFKLLHTELLDQETTISVFNKRQDHIITFVIVDNDLPIATASLLLEWKFIHGGMLYGHLEDVATHPNHRLKGIGTKIVEHTMKYAEAICGKVVLECKQELQEFYEKHGFQLQKQTLGNSTVRVTKNHITMKRHRGEFVHL
jgi:glucosamine-phosphate N-acetyltransferase